MRFPSPFYHHLWGILCRKRDKNPVENNISISKRRRSSVTPLMVEKSPLCTPEGPRRLLSALRIVITAARQDWLARAERSPRLCPLAVDTAVLNRFRVGETGTCPQMLAPARFEVSVFNVQQIKQSAFIRAGQLSLSEAPCMFVHGCSCCCSTWALAPSEQ